MLAGVAQADIEFEGVVKMVLDRTLHAPGDDDDMFNPRREGLGDDVVEHGPVDDRQQFLGNALGRRKHACPETGGRDDGFADSSGAW